MMRMMKTNSQELLEAVAELSPSASKLLLVLLLGQGSVESQPRIASLIGCSRRSVARALSELKARGLIVSIAQDAKYCLALSGAVLPAFLNRDVEQPGGETDEPDEPEPEEATPINIGETDGVAIVTDPLEMCRVADEKKDRKAQVWALQAVWDDAYPAEEYAYQRLQEPAAKALLSGHSSFFVGSAIYHGRATAKGEIKSPLGYTRKVLTTFKLPEQVKQEETAVITDDLRSLVSLGRQMFGGGA